MILSINQPSYLSWIGYYKRILKSDIHLILDDVQIELRTKNSFTNRNKVKSKNGFIFLTIPLITYENRLPLINKVKIDNSQKWQKKHLETIRQCYSKSPFFNDYFHLFEEAFSIHNEWIYLLDIINYFNNFIIDYFKLDNNVKIYKSSDIATLNSKKNLILEYCDYFKCTTYISGPLGQNYIDINDFNKRGIKLIFDDYVPKYYKQINGNFLERMTIFDLIFNLGKESRNFIENS
tara:strand:- start:329 stop:1033 length:705 start_codon:yes stop_codon:yes gene_type:complete